MNFEMYSNVQFISDFNIFFNILCPVKGVGAD